MRSDAVSRTELLGAQLLAKLRPQQLLHSYVRRAARQGLQRTYFILSFDCDTERDIEVVGDLHDRLRSLGITPVYAVPGALLEKGADAFRAVAATGAEFINHGYAVHTLYRSGTAEWESTLFYDRLPAEAVVEDIKRGHEAIVSVLGAIPAGFRVPHFGTFQRPEHLTLLHDTLSEMGYRYSSSTLPLTGLLRGPARRVRNDLWEIPVSGCFDNPLQILDSWSFRFAPGARSAGREGEYRVQMEKMLEFFSDSRPGLLNYYADPSQVHDWDDFFRCMEKAAPIAIGSYRELIDILESAGD